MNAQCLLHNFAFSSKKQTNTNQIVDAGKAAKEAAEKAAKEAAEKAKQEADRIAEEAKKAAEEAKKIAENTINVSPQEASFPLDLTINKTVLTYESSSGLSIDLACVNCKTFGTLKIGGHVKGTIVPPKVDEFWMSVSPSGLGIDLTLAATLEGAGELTRDIRFAELPIPAFAIFQKIISFGPKMILSGSIGLKDVEVIEDTAVITTGVKASLSKDASTKIDFTGKSGSGGGKWEPTMESKPITLSAGIDGSFQVYTKLAISVEAEFLGMDAFLLSVM